jgi:hypothetical protein
MSELLTTDEAAEILGQKPANLRVWKFRGQGPAWVKIGVAVMYRREDLEAYLNERATTSDN